MAEIDEVLKEIFYSHENTESPLGVPPMCTSTGRGLAGPEGALKWEQLVVLLVPKKFLGCIPRTQQS